MDAASTLQHSLPILFRRLLCLSAICAAISSAPTRLLLSLPTHSPPLHPLPHSAFLIHSCFVTASTAAQSPHTSLRRFLLIGFQLILLLFAFLQLFILGGSLSLFLISSSFASMRSSLPLFCISYLFSCLVCTSLLSLLLLLLSSPILAPCFLYSFRLPCLFSLGFPPCTVL